MPVVDSVSEFPTPYRHVPSKPLNGGLEVLRIRWLALAISHAKTGTNLWAMLTHGNIWVRACCFEGVFSHLVRCNRGMIGKFNVSGFISRTVIASNCTNSIDVYPRSLSPWNASMISRRLHSSLAGSRGPPGKIKSRGVKPDFSESQSNWALPYLSRQGVILIVWRPNFWISRSNRENAVSTIWILRVLDLAENRSFVHGDEVDKGWKLHCSIALTNKTHKKVEWEDHHCWIGKT